ncbi:MAG: WbqC family protein [Deltaproteobacteria bacterium]|nr:WbqC family protein [Deltaproteobacteria bacterium]
MIVAVHQPQFMPWLGYLDKMDRADVFVFLDNVQFRKNEFQNRNRIKTPQGWQWITVPVNYRFPQMINEVRINNQDNWKKRHIRSIEINYRRSPYFDKYFHEVLRFYSRDYEYLSEINMESVRMLSRLMGIDTATYRASEINGLREDQTLRLVDICRYSKADRYLSGDGAKGYLDISAFQREGIEVVFQGFTHQVYPQLYGGFHPFMSAIDMLFNCGEESLRILRGERE